MTNSTVVYLVKIVEYIMKKNDDLVKIVEYIIKENDDLVKIVEYIIKENDEIGDGKCLTC